MFYCLKNSVLITLFICCFVSFGNAAGLNDNIKPYIGKLTPVEIDRTTLGEMEKYVVGTYEDENGQILVKVTVPGVPPKERISNDVITLFGASDVVISNVPAFNWTYGCSATSAGMLCGYYDRNGYSNLYTGSINGGVCPLDNSAWGPATAPGSDGECSFIASHNGIDGRTTRGHVDDYWINYDAAGDPYYGKWTPHNVVDSGDCLADFMGTSQYYPVNAGNTDGATSYLYQTNGLPYSGFMFDDIAYGVQRYIRNNGYSVSLYYNQLIYGYNGNTQGFTFAQYMAEIDAGNPVFIHVTGHTMLGVGYEESTSTIYLHDTWNYSQHSMTWGGTYSTMTHMAVTVVNIDAVVPLSVPTNVTATKGTYPDKVQISWGSVPGATHYKVYLGVNAKNRLYYNWMTGTSLNDSYDPSGTTYSYWVIAASSDTGSNASDFSSAATGYAITKLPYVNWVVAKGIPLGQQAWDDAPATDGIENIWKYAMGLEPTTSYNWGNVFTYAKNDYDEEFYVSYTKAKTADVTVLPEWKKSLMDSTWMPTGMVSRLESSSISNETWKYAIPMKTNGFIRLKVSMEQ